MDTHHPRSHTHTHMCLSDLVHLSVAGSCSIRHAGMLTSLCIILSVCLCLHTPPPHSLSLSLSLFPFAILCLRRGPDVCVPQTNAVLCLLSGDGHYFNGFSCAGAHKSLIFSEMEEVANTCIRTTTPTHTRLEIVLMLHRCLANNAQFKLPHI